MNRKWIPSVKIPVSALSGGSAESGAEIQERRPSVDRKWKPSVEIPASALSGGGAESGAEIQERRQAESGAPPVEIPGSRKWRPYLPMSGSQSLSYWQPELRQGRRRSTINCNDPYCNCDGKLDVAGGAFPQKDHEGRMPADRPIGLGLGLKIKKDPFDSNYFPADLE